MSLKKTANGEVCLEPVPPKERYNCPRTGAHFKFTDIVAMLEKIKVERDKEDLARSTSRKHTMLAKDNKMRQKSNR